MEQTINKLLFGQLIKQADFKNLFNELGWDKAVKVELIEVKENIHKLEAVAEKRGFIIFHCKDLPDKNTRKSIDIKITKLYQEHLVIYTNTTKQMWQLAIREQNKPLVVREIEYHTHQEPELLYQKLKGLFFTIDEEDKIGIVDVSLRVKEVFNANAEKVTKKFYERFKTEHNAFLSFIKGIDDKIGDKENRMKQWYASLMLNRLMFIYFIQRKGFLDNGNTDYLKQKLSEVQKLKGKNQFFGTFYKSFLLKLFHDALGSPLRKDKELLVLLGKIPYLNGGLFDEHEIEKQFKEIDIKDKAFENIFEFFDEYNWHLDTNITATGKDINPDVIGYIFEKYINDRAAMGAYYTKEDITEYIGKNTILPYLFEETKRNCKNAFAENSSLWEILKNDPDKYIYDAVKKGVKLKLPENIEIGNDTKKPNLIERRKEWNKPAPEEFALPTEIWREVIERRTRYFEINKKIENGEIRDINDFITYNLNIRQFAQDALRNYEGSDFIQAFYTAIAGRKADPNNSAIKPLLGIAILDPTQGSGAFLFAALNILEPLYEECINRMKEFVEEDDKKGGKKYHQFRLVLDDMKNNHPSEKYYILKSIILNNLYGVDIMNEAVEIAKLRLFLKLVATVDVDESKDNMGLEPLPDIDFNIRCGNTLVGFATFNEILDITQGAYQGSIDKVKADLEYCRMAYETFKIASITNDSTLKSSKEKLLKKLNDLNETLNSFYAKLYNIESKALHDKYQNWKNTHQPFHWFAEFYEIIHDKGGFDVVIGNPPYVEYSSIKKTYTIFKYESLNSGNLYAYIIERCLSMMNNDSHIGMIIQMSAFCTPRMKSFQDVWFKNSQFSCLSFFDDRPGKLFDSLEHIRVSICLSKKGITNKFIATTNYNKFYSEFRNFLFENIHYVLNDNSIKETSVLKVNNVKEHSIIDKMWNCSNNLSYYLSDTTNDNYVYYGYGYGYFGKILNFKSHFKGDNIQSSTGDKYIYVRNEFDRDIIVALMNSSLFYWFYVNYSDGHNFTKHVIGSIPFEFPTNKINVKIKNLVNKLMLNLSKNSYRKNAFYKSTGNVEYDEYYPKKSKHIIDEIDKALAEHYGFTEEELDFIINYDIKYRMGKEEEE